LAYFTGSLRTFDGIFMTGILTVLLAWLGLSQAGIYHGLGDRDPVVARLHVLAARATGLCLTRREILP
jgi:hypothetical protein